MCTHNLCFGTKIRKIGIPLYIPLLGSWGYTFHGYVFLMDHVIFLRQAIETSFKIIQLAGRALLIVKQHSFINKNKNLY